MTLVQRNNRNNLWARYRRLLNLLGTEGAPDDSLVTLVGDTREPGVPLPGQGYRRFACAAYFTTMNVNWFLKWRADADVVITRAWCMWRLSGATASPYLRLASPSQVASEAPGYAPVQSTIVPSGNAGGSFRDFVDGRLPPMSFVGGAVGGLIGNACCALTTSANNTTVGQYLYDVHLPSGAGLILDANQSLTEVVMNLEGYVTGRNDV